jgi:hypothetical protein
MSKHYLRKRDVARRYGVDERTVDRMKGRRIRRRNIYPVPGFQFGTLRHWTRPIAMRRWHRDK